MVNLLTTVAVCLSGNMLVSINKVILCQTQLLLRQMTICRWVNHLGMKPATQVNPGPSMGRHNKYQQKLGSKEADWTMHYSHICGSLAV